MKIAAVVMLLVAFSSPIFAWALPVPEVSPASAVGAFTLLGGALLVIRGRRRK